MTRDVVCLLIESNEKSNEKTLIESEEKSNEKSNKRTLIESEKKNEKNKETLIESFRIYGFLQLRGPRDRKMAKSEPRR